MSADRFVLHEKPNLRPGECFICKGIKHSPFVDAGVDDPYYGTYLFCASCVRQMYEKINGDAKSRDEELLENSVKNYSDGFKAGESSVLVKVNDFLGGLAGSAPAIDTSDLGRTALPDGQGSSGPKRNEKNRDRILQLSNEEGSGATLLEDPDGVPGDSGDGEPVTSNPFAL